MGETRIGPGRPAAYGFEPEEGGPELARATYGAYFDYVNGSPGYVGDVYLLLGDNLAGPLVLIRNRDGKLQPAGYDEYLALGASPQGDRRPTDSD